MKVFSAALVTAILGGAIVGGCNKSQMAEAPSDSERLMTLDPHVKVNPPVTIEVGTSTRLMAMTQNLVAAKGVAWTASPAGSKIAPEQGMAGQTAIFTADQPGTYVVTASVDMGNGRVISDKTTVTVKGIPTASERMPEQPR